MFFRMRIQAFILLCLVSYASQGKLIDFFSKFVGYGVN